MVWRKTDFISERMGYSVGLLWIWLPGLIHGGELKVFFLIYFQNLFNSGGKENILPAANTIKGTAQ